MLLPLRRTLLLTTLASAGCTFTDAPEPLTLVGTYTTDLRLVSNTCGAGGLNLPTYDERIVEVRGYAGESASFAWEGSASVPGAASSTGTYRFVNQEVREMIAADALLGYPGCSVVQQTEVVFTLAPTPFPPMDAGMGDAGDAGDGGLTPDAGVSALTLDGTLVMSVVPTVGSDCSPLLPTYGGTWSAVPCEARMTLDGTRR